jgi:hypothetical protein
MPAVEDNLWRYIRCGITQHDVRRVQCLREASEGASGVVGRTRVWIVRHEDLSRS